MVKTKTSGKHQTYLEKLAKIDLTKKEGIQRSNPRKILVDEHKISLAIFECLLNNDPEGVMEMVEIYLDAVNKSSIRRRTGLSKSTMYSALKGRNPTIKTLAKIMYTSTH